MTAEAESKSTPFLVTATENSTARTEDAQPEPQPPPNIFLCCFNRVTHGHSPDCLRTSELQRANRLAMAIKRAKGCCEAHFKLSEYATTRCMRGVGLGAFYTTDGRVRMLCDECWEEAADIQQWNVAHRMTLTP